MSEGSKIEENLYSKVQTFWDAHKIWKNLPHGLKVNCVNVQSMRKLAKTFLCVSESPNFSKKVVTMNRTGLESCTNRRRHLWMASKESRIKTWCLEKPQTTDQVIQCVKVGLRQSITPLNVPIFLKKSHRAQRLKKKVSINKWLKKQEKLIAPYRWKCGSLF